MNATGKKFDITLDNLNLDLAASETEAPAKEKPAAQPRKTAAKTAKDDTPNSLQAHARQAGRGKSKKTYATFFMSETVSLRLHKVFVKESLREGKQISKSKIIEIALTAWLDAYDEAQKKGK